MPRRIIPLLLLVVLVVLTAVFAVVGAASAPTASTIQVQNAAEQTFGTPAGATSWLLALTASVSGAPGAENASEERVVRYTPPDRMQVYSVSGSTARLAGVVPPAQIPCILSSYSALLQGPGSWQQNGELFTRTESLADYSGRVPVAGSGGSCVPQPSTEPGQVHETAVVRAGYLIATRARIATPTHGTQGLQLVFLTIGGIPVTTLKKS